MASKWTPLKPGDFVDVIAPGFSCTLQDIENAAAYIRSLDLRPRIPKDLLGRDLICSNSSAVRLKHIKNALKAKDAKMLWCIRGGYGAIQLLPELSKIQKPARAKLFWGYSDATTLHVFFNQKWRWSSVHGPLLDRLGAQMSDQVTRAQLQRILFGQSDSISFEGLRPMNPAAKMKKQINAPIIGGNMTVLASSLGTPWAFRARGKILFLEDTGERAYRIDRMLQQFQQSKAMEGIKALVLGDFLGAPDKDGITRVPALWEQFANSAKYPVLSGMPVGHGEGQMPLPFNTASVLKLGSDPSLTCSTGI